MRDFFTLVGIGVIALLILGTAIPILDLSVRFWVDWWWKLRKHPRKIDPDP